MNRNITATILIILAIGVYFTVTKGILADASTVSDTNKSYEKAIEDANKLIAKRDQVREIYNSLSAEDRARLQVMVPKNVDNIRLILDLNSIARQNGLILSGIKAGLVEGQDGQQPSVARLPSGETPFNPLSAPMPVSGNGQSYDLPNPVMGTIVVSFGVTASYEQFIGFLRDLEANLRIMDITHIQMTASDKGAYEWSVELQTYWIKSQ